MLCSEDNTLKTQQQAVIRHKAIEDSSTQHPTLLAQEEFIEVNSDRNSTNTDDLTITSHNAMKPDIPVCGTHCPQEAQLSRNHNQMANNWPSIWENRAPIESAVNSCPAQQETDIQHHGHTSGGTRCMDHSSLFCRETRLNSISLSNNQQSFQNTFHTQFNSRRQSELNLLDLFGVSYSSNVGTPFYVSQTNMFERDTNQPPSLYQQYLLSHDQLHNDFLNREMLDFDTGLLESTDEQSSNTESSANFIERPERELEQSNEASQFSSTNAEENSINQYRFSNSDVYIDAYNQTSDVLLERSNHSVEFKSQFYEKSVGPDKITETGEIWEERRNDPIKQSENKQNNRSEQNNCATVVHENWTFSPKDVITPDESRRQRLTIGANIESDRLGVIENATADNVMNQEVDKNNPKVAGGPVVFDNHEETLFYESRMKEIDAIDSALSSVEQKMKIYANCYDLDSTNAKNIQTFQHIEYRKGETESFIPETIEITVMPFTMSLGDSPPTTDIEEPEESSQTHGAAEELDESNIPGSSTTFEMEPSQETSSEYKIEKDQLSEEAAIEESTVQSSLTQIQHIKPCSTSANIPQSDNIQENKSEDMPGSVNLESGLDCFGKIRKITPDNEVIHVVGKNDPNPVDESTIISIAEEKERTDSIISETMDITALPSAIGPNLLLPPESEVQEKFEIQYSTGELPGPNILEFSRELEMNPVVITESQSETENDQPFKEGTSSEVLSIELSSLPQMQKAPCSSSIEGGYIPEKETEDEHEGVNIKSDGPDRLGETPTITPDNETNQMVNKNDPSIEDETISVDKTDVSLHQESEIDTIERIDVALPLKETNTKTDSNPDHLSCSTRTQGIKTKMMVSEEGTEEESITAQPSTILPEHHLSSETKTRENSDIQNPSGKLSEPNTSETSTILEMNPSGTGLQSETNIEKFPMEGTSSEVLSIEPSSLPQSRKAQSISSVYGIKTDNIPVKESDDEHGSVSLELSGPDHSGETQIADIETNQVVDKNDPTIINEPAIFGKAEETIYHESKIKENEEIDIALPLKEKDTQIDYNAYNLRNSSDERSIETNSKHIEEGANSVISGTLGVMALPTTPRPEHDLPCEIKTQETSEIQNPDGESPEPNTSESSTILEKNPLGKTGSLGEKQIDQPPKEGSSTEVSSIEPSSLAQTQKVPIPNKPSIQEVIHDNIEIHISPSELVWLSEPETQTEIGSHPCFEPLENYQIGQVPLSIDGMQQITMPDAPRNEECTEGLSGQICSEKLGGSSLLEASTIDEQHPTSDRSAIPESEHVSTEAVTEPVNAGVTLPQRSADEPIVVSFESEPSTSSVESHPVHPPEPVPSCSGQTWSVKQEDQAIADEPSDDDAPLAKRKRTGSKSSMKLRVKETRKSSRIKKSPDRLFYIGKGQLF